MSHSRRSAATLVAIGAVICLALPVTAVPADPGAEGREVGTDAEEAPASDDPIEVPECTPEMAGTQDCWERVGPEDWTREQQRLADDYLTEIYEVAYEYPGWAEFGRDPETGAIILWFSGALPDELQGIIDRAERDGIGFVHVDTTYSEDELLSLAYKLIDAYSSEGIWTVAIRPTPNFDGLEVGFWPFDEQVPGSGALNDPELLDRAKQLAGEIAADVPIRFFEDDPVIAAAGRQDDTSPFSGAARLRMFNGTQYAGICTGGIPMHAEGTSSRYILTAAHCAQWNNGWTFKTGGNTTIGTNSWTTTLQATHGLDATLIRVEPVHTVRGRLYNGGWGSTTTIPYAGIHPWAQSAIGCLTASVTGERCQLKRNGVAAGPTQVCLDNPPIPSRCRYVTTFPVVQSTPGPTRVVVAGGDSGAPFFESGAGDARRVLGIVSAGSGQLPCDGQTYSAPGFVPTCYSKVFVTPINRINNVLSPYGIHAFTG